ncbi:MAG TPA: hypothetical protein VEH08_03880 [Methanomassiliicoccales archaeon]|nr:hypothetical protein [Methanomassiliicoccales archaeon]
MTPTIKVTEQDNKTMVTVTLVVENAEITPQMRELLGKVADHGLKMTSRIVDEMLRREVDDGGYCDRVAAMLPKDESSMDKLDSVR